LENGPKINHLVSLQEGKGLSAVAIDDNPVATLGAEGISYPSVQRQLREARLATSNPEASFSQLDIEPDDCDEAILLALNEQLFASIRQLARLTHLPRTTIHRRLTRSLGFYVQHLRCIPHRPSDTQQSNRVELSRALLSLLTTQQGRYWHDIVTLDWSWFYLNTDHELIWFRADEKGPEREDHTVHSAKSMLTIIWNPNGFHWTNVL
jgi:hypothetical protein